MPNGSVFRFSTEKNNDAAQEPYQGVPKNGSLADTTSTASINIVPNDSETVKVGFAYSRETIERNIYDIVPDRKVVERVNREYFHPVHEWCRFFL